MATLALAAVGNAVLPGAGQFVGAILGNAIDNMLLVPLIFGEQNSGISGSRVEGLRFQSAQEGSPISFCLGPQNRVPGNLIYLSELEEVLVREKVRGGKAGGGPKATTEGYEYYQTFAVVLSEANAGGTIEKVWADSKLIYDRNGQVDERYDSITLYNGYNQTFPGSGAQLTADPDIVAAKARDGVNTPTPAYRGSMYLVIKDLNLRDWGNRTPQISALVKAQDACPVKLSLDLLCDRAELEATEYNTDAVPGCLRGYTLQGPQPVVNSLQILMMTYNLGVQDRQGVLTFFDKKDSQIYDISIDDMAARSPGEAAPRPYNMRDVSDYSLPSEVVVRYIEPWFDWQTGVQRAQIENFVIRNKEQVEVPLVLTPDEGRNLAQRLLDSVWAERQKVKFTLPPSHMYLLEGDVVRFEHNDRIVLVRLTNVSIGSNWVMELEGVVQSLTTFNQAAVGTRPGGSSGSRPYRPPELEWSILNLPPLESGDEEGAFYYATAQRKFQSDSYAGAVLYRSSSELGTYESRGVFSSEGAVGRITTVLPTASVFNRWDRSSTVTVFSRVPLVSASEEEVLSGANAILIGDEIVQYRDAESLGDNLYTLSHLLRGRRDTVMYATGHMVGDRAIPLSRDGRIRIDDFNPANTGSTFWFKAVATGQLVGSVTGTSAVMMSKTLVPFSPAGLVGDAGTGTRTIRWQPRIRGFYNDWLSATVLGLDEPRYKVEIKNTSNTWVTLDDNVTTNSFGLTASHRTTAGYANNVLVPVRVSQYSSNLMAFGRTKEAML